MVQKEGEALFDSDKTLSCALKSRFFLTSYRCSTEVLMFHKRLSSPLGRRPARDGQKEEKRIGHAETDRLIIPDQVPTYLTCI